MAFRNIFFAAAFDNGPGDMTAAELASRLVASNGHMSAALGAVTMELPGVDLLPMAHAVLDLVNERRLGHANAQKTTIERLAGLEGFVVEADVIHKSRHAFIEHALPFARLADLCVLPRPTNETGAARSLAEGILFGSGRPVLLVPPKYSGDAAFRRILIGWDGSARAARAVGDAQRFLVEAEHVQIVCVAEEAKGTVAGADLAARLSRECRNVDVVDLAPVGGDVYESIRRHIEAAQPDLLVTGAYVHARVVELIAGGVTKGLLLHSETPLLLSY
jgi:nucleotide-binding universal stress UspA family protein